VVTDAVVIEVVDLVVDAVVDAIVFVSYNTSTLLILFGLIVIDTR